MEFVFVLGVITGVRFKLEFGMAKKALIQSSNSNCYIKVEIIVKSITVSSF